MSSPETTSTPTPPAAPAGGGLGAIIPFDPLRLALAVWKGKWWVIGAALLLGAPAVALGYLRLATSYTVSVQLIRRELPNSFRVSDLGEAFKPRQLSVASIVSIMRSPSLLTRVGGEVKPRIGAGALLRSLTITPEKNTDLITVTLRADRSAAATVELINRYAGGVVELTSSLQQQEAAELDRFLREQLGRADSEYGAITAEILQFTKETGFYSAEKEVEAYLRELGEAESRLQTAALESETVRFQIEGLERELARQSPLLLDLSNAKDQLKTLLVRYTEANPLVMEQRARVLSLETEVANSTNSVQDFQPGGNTVANAMFTDLVSLRAQRLALAQQEKPLRERLAAVQLKLSAMPQKDMQFARMRAKQQALETTRSLLAARQREAQLFSESSPGYYRLFAPATPDDVEVSSKKQKLIILGLAAVLAGAGLATLGLCVREALDTRVLSPADMRRVTGAPMLGWLGDLSLLKPDQLALWRFRTWSALFRTAGRAETRSLVAGIVSLGSGEGRSTWIRLLEEAAAERDFRTLILTNGVSAEEAARAVPLPEALQDPTVVTQRLERTHAARVILTIPSDWQWDSEQRGHWILALREWQKLPRLALFLELPPARRLDTLLLAETLPQLLWLSRSGASDQDEVKEVIRTLKSGDGRVSGVLANWVPAIFDKLPDLGRFGLLLLLGWGLSWGSPVQAQEPAPTNSFLSATARGPQLAGWQKHLTLGAGDQVNLMVYGHKDLTRSEVAIGPDGRISYLQAQGIQAAGLTIDELRQKLTEELSKYYRNARVVITPASFRSKKYFLLGTVIDRGAYPLDRPMTIIEAIARARGIATGLLEQNTVEIADLPRAFLVRNQKRVPVDFVKLFQQGDLSQNIQLEPDDYIYFPSSTVNEVYILGSVSSPGTVGVTESSTVVGVLTVRGGFTDKAYRQRVLVVRGSLNQPETFVVNVAEILRGNTLDFRLKPKDIVYVTDRPWARAEELLDMAISAFVTTAMATWAGQNIGPFITQPIVPSTR